MSETFRWGAVAFLSIIAAVLAWRKTEGWGWFLFIAFIVLMSNVNTAAA